MPGHQRRVRCRNKKSPDKMSGDFFLLFSELRSAATRKEMDVFRGRREILPFDERKSHEIGHQGRAAVRSSKNRSEYSVWSFLSCVKIRSVPTARCDRAFGRNVRSPKALVRERRGIGARHAGPLANKRHEQGILVEVPERFRDSAVRERERPVHLCQRVSEHGEGVAVTELNSDNALLG